ncbi:hypothetical protein QN277_006106 [Acacia crassicarpa]|uniref:Late embryogenesis abundant protein n=1 Tax=Acacia crassicarpa TaxID=499986 RepID=A0AAE1IXL4_9FABA|nr:hypothetical protein QN277_006106 [Acacia crassicarpa]
MAATFMTRTVLFRFSKSIPQAIFLRSSHKPSRVVFASASSNNNYSHYRNTAEGADARAWSYDPATARREEYDRDMGDRVRDGAEEVKEYGHEAKEKTKDMAERTKQYAHETKEEAKDAAETMADRASEGTNKASEKMKDYAYDVKDTAKGAADTVADKTKEGAHKTADMAESATEKTADTMKYMGEKAKETAKGAWGAAKDTTQKIKETVVGKDDDDDDDREGRWKKGEALDEDVVELRREAGKGYDARKGV